MNALTNERLEDVVSGDILFTDEQRSLAEETLSLRAQLAELRGQAVATWTEGSEPKEFGKYYVRYIDDDGRVHFTIAKWMRYNFCASSDTNIHNIWLDDRSRSITAMTGVTHFIALPIFGQPVPPAENILFEPEPTDSANSPLKFSPEQDTAWVVGAEWMREEFKKANKHLKLAGDDDPERARDVAEGGVEVQPLGVCSASQPSYRDGIEAAAKWLDKQRESFDNEHGRHDPDTGTFEFGNDAQLEYSSTLAELSEGIRALQPAASLPKPVATLDVQSGRPDGKKFALVYSSAAHELPDDVYHLYTEPQSHPYTVPDEISVAEAIERSKKDPTCSPAIAYQHGWKDRSAAMLQSGNSELVDFRDRCRKLVGVGARTPDFAVFANIESALRRSNCLSAIERYMSVHVGTDDNDDTPMYRELLNWGEEPAKYIETFKAALPKFSTADYPVVPDGWALVPIEPTWEMLSEDGCKEHHKGQECLHHDNRRRIWRAMLSAAPQHKGE